MKIKIEIKTDNAAFHPDEMDRMSEVYRILSEICNKISQGKVKDDCFDFNGNVVGKWEVKGK
jgi:hypothetical protein